MVSHIKISSNAYMVEDGQDLINNLPMVLTDKIYELLPLPEAAKTAVLSKNWRKRWSCRRKLVFDEVYWKKRRNNGRLDWTKYSSIISNILFHHHGPIHEFSLYIPEDPNDDIVRQVTLNLTAWLSFLSRKDIKKVALRNSNKSWISLPSHIYSFMNLEELVLVKFICNSPPSDFEGFEHLKKLVLVWVDAKNDLVGNLIALHRLKLSSLDLVCCKGVESLVIDVPRLKNLSIIGEYRSVDIKNAPGLVRLALALEGNGNDHLCAQIADTLKNATSCKLVFLMLGLGSNYVNVVGGIMRSLPLAFTHVKWLLLGILDLDDFDVVCCSLRLMQSCSSLQNLVISVSPSKNEDVQHKYAYDNNDKLSHLLEVKLLGITGSRAELKLIEYVLSVSNILEKLFIVKKKLEDTSELKWQRELNGLKRASPKARLEFLEE